MARPNRLGGPSPGVESEPSPGRQRTPASDRGGTGHHPRASRLARATTQVKILVPGDQNMVALLGQRDELLKLVEAAFEVRGQRFVEFRNFTGITID